MHVNAIPCTCEICHRVFFRWPSQIRNGEGRFCSRTCKHVRRPPAERFWERVDDSGGPDACWPWLGAFFAGKRYGQFAWAPGDNRRAHRVAWELTNGPIPAGLIVMHLCDNPACCNPSHLRLGTNAENMRDMVNKGRQSKGEGHWVRQQPERAKGLGFGGRAGESNTQAKLTAADVIAIRQARASGEILRVIAARYGIDQSTVSQIARRDIWKHID